jgi:hypothetical protein
MSRREWILLVGVVAYGTLLRAWDLGSVPFHVDEAESSINALSILQHGMPRDHYLGLPIYENTLTRSWPQSGEYEFKDSSYSESGLAIFHGWLPLYAIATSFALSGVTPEQESMAFSVQYSADEIHRRNVAGRLPAVIFGAVFLIVLFFTGREWYGKDAGWAAMTAGALSEPVIYFSRQARYYSATLALTMTCALMMHLMYRRGAWRDFLLGALGFVLLFHTHVLSFFSAVVALVLILPSVFVRPRALGKLAMFCVVVALGTVPWMALTGFVGSLAGFPNARSLLEAQDLTAFIWKLGPFPWLAMVSTLWLVAVAIWGNRLPGRLRSPFSGHTQGFLILLGWALISFLSFILFMPAVSYFHGRLVLTLMGPGILFAAMLFAATARVIFPNHSSLLASCLFISALTLAGQATFWKGAEPHPTPAVMKVIDYLRSREMSAATRIYATPNHHLLLTFYTGMPVQSIAPVRKSFLDQYEGDVVIVEAGPRFAPVLAADIQRMAAATGHPLSREEAERWLPILAGRLVRQELQSRVAELSPPVEPLPEYIQSVLNDQRQRTIAEVARAVAVGGNPMFKGYDLTDFQLWPVFYYRFVDVGARSGERLNYRDRIRDARAFVLPDEWVIYQCPARHAN